MCTTTTLIYLTLKLVLVNVPQVRRLVKSETASTRTHSIDQTTSLFPRNDHRDTVESTIRCGRQLCRSNRPRVNRPIFSNGVGNSFRNSSRCQHRLSTGKLSTVNRLLIPGVDISLPVVRNTNRSILRRATNRLTNADLPIKKGGAETIVANRSGLGKTALFAHLNRLRGNSPFCVGIVNGALTCQIGSVHVIDPASAGTLGVQGKQSRIALLAYAKRNGALHLLIAKRHGDVPSRTPLPNTSPNSAGRTTLISNIAIAKILTINFSLYHNQHISNERVSY